MEAQVWKAWEKKPLLRIPTLILPAHLEALCGDGMWQSCVVPHPLSHPMRRHIFMEEGRFYSKIRKKYWDAYFGPLSRPLFILPKGGVSDLVDKSREDASPGITSHTAVGGVLDLKSWSRLSPLLLSWPICAQADGSCEFPGSMVWSWQGGSQARQTCSWEAQPGVSPLCSFSSICDSVGRSGQTSLGAS